MKCCVCPRNCNVNRQKYLGFCSQGENVKISLVMLHHFEEPIISGGEKDIGSGAIFFTGCNLKCVFCQNEPISHGGKGEEISVGRLAEIFKELENKGALNINLVTPTHFANQIIEALKIYKPSIPVVWNSGGYESVETIEKLKDFVDIYLVDLKYMSNELAFKYSKAKNYVENATKSIIEMRKNQPKDIIENGLMKKGVIIRHLVLPTHTADSLKCLDFINSNIGKETIVSIMSQFEPKYVPNDYAEIKRKITPLEYKRVVNHALNLGMTNCFTQDLTSADTKYTPNF